MAHYVSHVIQWNERRIEWRRMRKFDTHRLNNAPTVNANCMGHENSLSQLTFAAGLIFGPCCIFSHFSILQTVFGGFKQQGYGLHLISPLRNVFMQGAYTVHGNASFGILWLYIMSVSTHKHPSNASIQLLYPCIRPDYFTAQQEVSCQRLQFSSWCLNAAPPPSKMSSGITMAFTSPQLIVQSSYPQCELPLSSSDISWHVRDIKRLMKGEQEASEEISNLDTCECSVWFREVVFGVGIRLLTCRVADVVEVAY